VRFLPDGRVVAADTLPEAIRRLSAAIAATYRSSTSAACAA
jgi:hypothetical protein